MRKTFFLIAAVGLALSASPAAWAGQTWNGQTWNGQTWNGQTWNGQTWNGQADKGAAQGPSAAIRVIAVELPATR
ncbi:MAG TPA: hypothetical protein VJR58_29570 [Vineibacter sp.]|nr:hypothetical protein [Vineibacter sp.]